MQGLAAVQARIARIESTIASMAGPAPSTMSTRSSAATGPASFDAALQDALASAPTAGMASAASAAGATPAVQRSPGDYGHLEPPAELRAYGNGRVPASALESIGSGDQRLWAPAAEGYRRMVADAAGDGVTIGVTDSYRDYATQVRLVDEKGLYSQGGLAAAPGTSNHGWGVAVDLDLDDRAQAWMRSNGWRYGFVEDVPREPWHWTYRPA
jgi:hypothetical protein